VTTDFKRRQIVGRGIPVTGNDIDTDRIIPARFPEGRHLRNHGEHAFEDARKQNPEHPVQFARLQGPPRSWWSARISDAAPHASTRPRR